MFSSKPKDSRTFTGTTQELWQSIVNDVRTERYWVSVIRPGETEPYVKLRVSNIGVVASIMPVDLSANRHKGAEVRFFDDNGLSRKLFSLMMREVGGQ